MKTGSNMSANWGDMETKHNRWDRFVNRAAAVAAFWSLIILLVLAASAHAQDTKGSATTPDGKTTVTVECSGVTNHCKVDEEYHPWGAGWDNDRAEWVAYKGYAKTCKAQGIKFSRFSKLDDNNACYSAWVKAGRPATGRTK